MTIYLPTEQIEAMLQLTVDSGWMTDETRKDLLQGIDPGFVASLPGRPSPLEQMRSDLMEMNRVEILIDGETPLLTWLANATNRARSSARVEYTVFEALLREVQQKQESLLASRSAAGPEKAASIPASYYERLIRDFQNLDIAGIDKDQSYKLPLSKVYVKLRVKSSEEPGQIDQEPGVIEIQDALRSYPRLVIVGDPGSGKSTFLRFIALMISRARMEENLALAETALSLYPPLPIPVFISLWDLSDDLKRSRAQRAGNGTVLEYILDRFKSYGVTQAGQSLPLTADSLTELLRAGQCCLLLDGLDEVPTEAMRGRIRELMEAFVEEYPGNRYVITSRTRGYTGEAIFGGEFQRCDIRDFDEEDIRQFARNWIAALKNIPPDEVERPDAPGHSEYMSLMEAVLHKEGVRALAKNPLLMTVIAIVHWNRTRLPEQRVELYDECIDVLLGQRKEAQRRKSTDLAELADPAVQKQVERDRTWVRKQFSEIALYIMLQEEERTITKKQLIGLLKEPMMNRYNLDEEAALLEAEHFLDEQELRSGLLVSRDRTSRFVHLTFQEYLAAWRLKSRRDYWTVIQPHLREQRWFETLQLLGGLLARETDEDLWEYLDNLLAQMGDTIAERAHIIALCANIVRDTQESAGLRPSTRQAYEKALRSTLGVFDPKEKVPDKTQLEVLDALAKLGRVVKDQLTQATKSQHRNVRTNAVEYLLPHIPDDDLFTRLTHLLNDKSKETIKTYLWALQERNPDRAKRLIQNWKEPGLKLVEAVAESKMLDWLSTFNDVLTWYDIYYFSKDKLPLVDLNFWDELTQRDEGKSRRLLVRQIYWTRQVLSAVILVDKLHLFETKILYDLISRDEMDILIEDYGYGGETIREALISEVIKRDPSEARLWFSDQSNWSNAILKYVVSSNNISILNEDSLFTGINILNDNSFVLEAYLNEAARRNESRLRQVINERGDFDFPMVVLLIQKGWLRWLETDRALSSLENFLEKHINSGVPNNYDDTGFNITTCVFAHLVRRDRPRALQMLERNAGKVIMALYPGIQVFLQEKPEQLDAKGLTTATEADALDLLSGVSDAEIMRAIESLGIPRLLWVKRGSYYVISDGVLRRDILRKIPYRSDPEVRKRFIRIARQLLASSQRGDVFTEAWLAWAEHVDAVPASDDQKST